MNLSWTPKASSEKDQAMLIRPTGPADEVESASLMFLHALNSAEKRIWIASPYFVPDDAIISAIQLAAMRGVDVRILIPDMPDHMTVYSVLLPGNVSSLTVKFCIMLKLFCVFNLLEG